MLAKKAILLIIPMIFMLALGCAMRESTARLTTPVTLKGVIPCADCPGLELTLTLRPDSIFFLKQVYFEGENGKDMSGFSWGTWSFDSCKGIISVAGDNYKHDFKVLDSANIRMLDIEGRDIESSLNYNLSITNNADLKTYSMFLSGHYRYMADAGRFVECRTGIDFPVAQVKDNALLEQMYRSVISQPGENVLIDLAGHLEQLPGMEGDALIEQLVVDRILALWPNDTCGSNPPSTLLNTYWKLTFINGKAMPDINGRQNPYLQITVDQDSTVHGFTGCNDFHGKVKYDERSLRFSKVSATRMACPDQNEIEPFFLKFLDETRSYSLEGDTLVLVSSSGEKLQFQFIRP